MLCSSLSPAFCRRGRVIFMSFVFICVQWCPTRLNYMSNMARVSYETDIVYPSRAHVFTSVFGGVRVANRFSFMCCVLCFVCFRLVSCAQCCQCLWIAHYCLPLRVSLTFM